MSPHLRIAKPVRDRSITTAMYCRGLGLRVVGRFEDHDGFDGVMLGLKDSSDHIEFTRCRTNFIEVAVRLGEGGPAEPAAAVPQIA